MAHELVLLDSDALVGWLTTTDLHHLRAVERFEFLKQQRMQPVVTNLVIAETATLLSYRQGPDAARQFVAFARSLKTIFITEQLHADTVLLFSQQTRSKTSFVDMANVVALRTFDIPLIFAFDNVYARDFNLPVLTPDFA